jgi:hypothetical protein
MVNRQTFVAEYFQHATRKRRIVLDYQQPHVFPIPKAYRWPAITATCCSGHQNGWRCGARYFHLAIAAMENLKCRI